MIFRNEIILSIVCDKRNNIIFYEKNVKLTKNITFDNVFVIEFSLQSPLTKFLKMIAFS